MTIPLNNLATLSFSKRIVIDSQFYICSVFILQLLCFFLRLSMHKFVSKYDNSTKRGDNTLPVQKNCHRFIILHPLHIRFSSDFVVFLACRCTNLHRNMTIPLNEVTIPSFSKRIVIDAQFCISCRTLSSLPF